MPALYPAATDLYSKKDNSGFLHLYERSFRYVFFTSLGLSCFIFFFSAPIFRIWLGQSGSPESISILRLLLLAFFCNIIAGPAAIFARAASLQKIETFANLIMTILHIGLNLFFLNSFQESGIGWASFIAIGFTDVILMLYLNAQFKYSFLSLFSKIIFPATLLIMFSAGLSLTLFYFSGAVLETYFEDIRFQITFSFLISGTAYVVFLLWGSLRLNIIEKTLIYDVFKSLRFFTSSEKKSAH
jgi:O-antigen/teichoic acid export membrane protein